MPPPRTPFGSSSTKRCGGACVETVTTRSPCRWLPHGRCRRHGDVVLADPGRISENVACKLPRMQLECSIAVRLTAHDRCWRERVYALLPRAHGHHACMCFVFVLCLFVVVCFLVALLHILLLLHSTQPLFLTTTLTTTTSTM